MIDRGKHNVLGVLVDAVDYEAAASRILAAALEGRPHSCTALAVHGVMTAVLDPEQRYRINALDLVTPDGQPVRWALNALYGCGLTDRVYGPELMHEVCAAAGEHRLPIFLFGSRPQTLSRLRVRLTSRHPKLRVAGTEASTFRQLSERERSELLARIRASGAAMLFVGLGCPRQEVFAYECAEELSMPVISVGAAFDFHAGEVSEPPARVQALGLQWAYRLAHDPRRLWKRYLGLNPLYLLLLAMQLIRVWRPRPQGIAPAKSRRFG